MVDSSPQPGSPTPRNLRRPLGAAIASVALIGALVGVGVAVRSSDTADDRPNILIIVTDDQRDAGTMHVLPRTAALFGDAGTRFEHGVVTTPLCCPSRASIFSGQYTHNHGVHKNVQGERFDTDHSIQAELSEAGYHTALVGKFLNGVDIEKPPPHFDRYAVFDDGYYDQTFNVDGELVEPEYSTTFIQEKSLEYLEAFESDDATPWMMEIAPFAPHGPGAPEAKYADADVGDFEETPATTERNLSDKPAYVRESVASLERVKRVRREGLRSLLSVDDLVAAVFEQLEATGEANNTLAFFLSDNGWQWFEHQQQNKRYPYNDSIEVPFYARWPARTDLVPAGEVDDERIVANIDIAPTVYEAAGVDPDYTVDGRSIFSSDRRRILVEWTADDPIPKWRALWTPTSSYIVYPETGERELYAPRDPWQLRNVFGNDDDNEPPAKEVARWDRWLRDAAGCPETTPCP